MKIYNTRIYVNVDINTVCVSVQLYFSSVVRISLFGTKGLFTVIVHRVLTFLTTNNVCVRFFFVLFPFF